MDTNPKTPVQPPLLRAGVFWCEKCETAKTIETPQKAPVVCECGGNYHSIGWFEYVKEERRAREVTPKQASKAKKANN